MSPALKRNFTDNHHRRTMPHLEHYLVFIQLTSSSFDEKYYRKNKYIKGIKSLRHLMPEVTSSRHLLQYWAKLSGS
ncbi:hypothetical protein OIU84_027844 [Salix udensis]|uniref:Uncharacterized protein n=1 Tax=Salix udensis TaxID=889485 RepID=A0AAD6KDM2_9ROSI|nr:hypothetical protein OIU84_027844 [Salix udensis]